MTKSANIRTTICPIATPLADDKLRKKIYKITKKGKIDILVIAAKEKFVKRGVKEVGKFIKRGDKGLKINFKLDYWLLLEIYRH